MPKRVAKPLRVQAVRLGGDDDAALARIAKVRRLGDVSKAIREAIQHYDQYLGDGIITAAEPPIEAASDATLPPLTPSTSRPTVVPPPRRGQEPVKPCPKCGRDLGVSYHREPHGGPIGSGIKCPGVAA